MTCQKTDDLAHRKNPIDARNVVPFLVVGRYLMLDPAEHASFG